MFGRTLNCNSCNRNDCNHCNNQYNSNGCNNLCNNGCVRCCRGPTGPPGRQGIAGSTGPTGPAGEIQPTVPNPILYAEYKTDIPAGTLIPVTEGNAIRFATEVHNDQIVMRNQLNEFVLIKEDRNYRVDFYIPAAVDRAAVDIQLVTNTGMGDEVTVLARATQREVGTAGSQMLSAFTMAYTSEIATFNSRIRIIPPSPPPPVVAFPMGDEVLATQAKIMFTAFPLD